MPPVLPCYMQAGAKFSSYRAALEDLKKDDALNSKKNKRKFGLTKSSEDFEFTRRLAISRYLEFLLDGPTTGKLEASTFRKKALLLHTSLTRRELKTIKIAL